LAVFLATFGLGFGFFPVGRAGTTNKRLWMVMILALGMALLMA
jgi:hypothetical protein